MGVAAAGLIASLTVSPQGCKNEAFMRRISPEVIGNNCVPGTVQTFEEAGLAEDLRSEEERFRLFMAGFGMSDLVDPLIVSPELALVCELDQGYFGE